MLVKYLAGVVFMLGVGVLVHQNFTSNGGWFNWDQFYHHESLAVLCFVSSISLLIGRYARRK